MEHALELFSLLPTRSFWFLCFPDTGYLAIYQSAEKQTQDNPFKKPHQLLFFRTIATGYDGRKMTLSNQK